MPLYDFNVLEKAAQHYLDAGRPSEALRIYLFMADGDQSLDGGYLGARIGECYERLGDAHAAKYWYGRAVEENPAIDRYVDARKRFEHHSIDQLLVDLGLEPHRILPPSSYIP